MYRIVSETGMLWEVHFPLACALTVTSQLRLKNQVQVRYWRFAKFKFVNEQKQSDETSGQNTRTIGQPMVHN